MQFTAKITTIEKEATDCLIIGIYQNNKLSDAAKKIDLASQGYLKKILQLKDLTGEVGQTLLLPGIPNVAATRVLIVGCGEKSKLNAYQYNQILLFAFDALTKTQAKNAVCCLNQIEIARYDNAWRVKQVIFTCATVRYRFNQLKTVSAKPEPKLQELCLSIATNETLNEAQHVVREATAMVSGMQLCKDLGMLPSNICTPSYLADAARALAKQYKNLQANVLQQKDLEKLKMGALLAVAKGSAQPPQLIVMKYSGGKKNQAPIALVGKGITFDTGGYTLKPHGSMFEMKFDMLGAASILGTLKAIAELGLKINVVAVLAVAENLISGNAYKPSDIITSMSGKTIEIHNTDAEGRLILADALTYSQQFNPELIIDVATLTGAILVALGYEAAGLFSNDEALVAEILEAAENTDDKAWRMPLYPAYQPQLESLCADMKNVAGDRLAGSCIAASFLARFTEGCRWAHLDVAGSAFTSGSNAFATGRPVPLLTQFLINKAAQTSH